MSVRISAEQIAFRYAGKSGDDVFSGLSLEIRAGEIFCLLGPNGTGKTTLLKCLCGLLHCTHGRVLLDNRNILEMESAAVARKIGYVPQSQMPAFPFLVKDVVLMGRAPHLRTMELPSAKDMHKAYEAMKTIGIRHLAERPCTQLSGGEWQLTLLSRALAQEPQALVLDEPTSHLDVGHQIGILRVIKNLAQQGLTIIMATHFPDHALWVADRVAIVNHRHIAAQGTPEEVLTDEMLGSTYGVAMRILPAQDGSGRRVCLPVF